MTPRPLHLLAADAVLACARNAIPYAITLLAGLAITALARLTIFNDGQTQLFFVFVVAPIQIAIVYAFASAVGVPTSETLFRAFERSWAVVLIDFAVGMVQNSALASIVQGGALVDAFLGGLLMSATAFFVFADVDAVIGSHTSLIWVIPGALLRSIRTIIRSRIYPRAFLILIVQIGVYAASTALEGILARHLAPALASTIATVALQVVAVAPIGAFTALVYKEATSRESETDE